MAAAGILELRKKALLRLDISYIERILPRAISHGRDTQDISKAEEMGVYVRRRPRNRLSSHGYG